MVVPTMREAENVAGISLAMGIFGIVVGCAGYTMGFSVVGLLGSLISRRIKPERNGMAMAAMITSIVGIVISCIGVIYMSLMMPMMSDMDYMNILYNF